MRRVKPTDQQMLDRAVDAALAKVQNKDVREHLRTALNDEALICVGKRRISPEEIRKKISTIVRDHTKEMWIADADDSQVKTWLGPSGQVMLMSEVVEAIEKCRQAYEDVGE